MTVTTAVDVTGSGCVHEKGATDAKQRGPGAVWSWTRSPWRWEESSATVSGESSYYVRRVQDLRENQEPHDWCTTVLASWAASTPETYRRHMRHLATAQYAADCKEPIAILRGYLASRAATDKTSSNMRQITSACRLCEELALVTEFVPRSIWRMVRGKDRLAGKGASQGWGSVEVLECMAKRAFKAEERVVVALAALSIVYCLRISEAASTRSIDLVQEEEICQVL